MSFHEAYMRFYEACEWLEPELLVLDEAFDAFVNTLAVDEVETELLHERTGIERFPGFK